MLGWSEIGGATKAVEGDWNDTIRLCAQLEVAGTTEAGRGTAAKSVETTKYLVRWRLVAAWLRYLLEVVGDATHD